MSAKKDAATALGRMGSALSVHLVGAATALVDPAGTALERATGAVAGEGVGTVPRAIPFVELPPA